ncbi:MAG TPA: HAD-IB family phosphatase [Candidatus Saccharimonadales bacterium]|nr:HAD-IB family phosphatase [Candidatus Saccharimonadales bacterium]
MSVETTSYYPEGFFVNDLEQVQAKIGAIALDGAATLEARLDFDRTMTTNGAKDLTSWDILSGLLSPEAQVKDRELWNTYQPLELNHTLTRPQAETWWNETLQLYVDDRANIRHIETAARSVQLRPGTAEFFGTCRENGIHTTILSAGIHDVIDVVAARYGLDPDLILSTKLKSDPNNGRITGWDESTLIHILNKGEKGSPKLQTVRQQRPNTIVIGDALEDTRMADDHDEGAVLRIRVGDPHKIRPDHASEYMEESFLAGYDMVRLGDFHPINNLAAFIIGAADRVNEQAV